MVTDNTEQVATTTETPTAPEAEGDAVAEQTETPLETTEATAPEATAEPATEEAPVPPAATAPPAETTAAPVPGTAEPATAPATPQYTPEQIARMQQDAAQYEQVQRRAALQGQADTYKTQLEQQGYLPEQAQALSTQYMQGEERQQELIQQAQRYGDHLQGKQQAAEKMAKMYKLGIDDLVELRRYDDPQSMENAAKTISHNRQRDAELAALKQSQVPSQQVDNSQGSPEVAANEGSWLDRYNSGDRTANAVAAARRAAGLQ